MDALTTPSNWQRVRLGDICEIGKGQQINKISLNNTDKYPVINGGIDFLGYTNKFNVSKNTIAISEGGTCGYVRFMKSDFWSGGHNYSLQKISNKVNNLCLYHILKSYEKDIMKLGVGSGLKNIQLKALKDFEILLPPLNEQIAIVNILSDVDRYLYSLDALILKKESVKKALSFELLSQRKRLKGFNQAWQKVKLGDIAEIKRGVRITKNELDVFGKYPVVSGGVGFLGYTNNFNRYENTITIAQYGTAGYVNFQKNKFWANDICFCVYPNKDVIKNIFLYYFLKVNQNYLYEISNRNATPYSISKDKILDFEILLPPLNEQIAIANILSALDHEIISLKNKKRQFDNIKKALNHDLMSAKIRVLKK
ncbi:restriction endonuclease subunit S [Helicobacter pylori]|uniref:restriction endonuclease subunit S n=1 Tax=Helicobacter pylori TaxID=210 RepID=UPI0009A27EEF|nr:restriction endonuclease subunit S [Helicobacter pylori]NHB17470.1 restriction endonuclease subunit S [Helicobacter pylori]OPG44751.1 restriction endonuclease subunit S [Helicobacter pylori]QEF44671.1 restriction endonuclease subunit S [Helicobacter pylori]